MNTVLFRSKTLAAVFLVGVLCVAAPGQEADPSAPASQPASAPTPWGSPKAGLQASLELKGTAKVGQPLAFTCAVRNAGTQPVQVRPKEIFAWLFLLQTAGQTRRALFTAKTFVARDMGAWLKARRVHRFEPMDATGLKVYSYQRGQMVRGATRRRRRALRR